MDMFVLISLIMVFGGKWDYGCVCSYRSIFIKGFKIKDLN